MIQYLTNIYWGIDSEKNVSVKDKWTSLCQYGKYIYYLNANIIVFGLYFNKYFKFNPRYLLQFLTL